ncbi:MULTISPECIES: hypothetical protein [Nocardiaceae]|uniref:Secreted protein n=1 Tax=Rhodococcoides corynebacterioides TaxID=53972 RepID=A0ABS2KUC0_9NOCA|nr:MULTISPECIES: hypothetical protein [Rhodococcus]MBM7415401.1 hypothetical protein [Rhodococcus corynebacterioides]MBP1117863.1 hypothetical protein [Rhodococcus sp. PvP016]
MTRRTRTRAASAVAIAASVVGIAMAGAGTASAAEPTAGGPFYWESFSSLSLDPNGVPCSERAAANRARGDIILVECRAVTLGFDSVDLIGIRAGFGS